MRTITLEISREGGFRSKITIEELFGTVELAREVDGRSESVQLDASVMAPLFQLLEQCQVPALLSTNTIGVADSFRIVCTAGTIEHSFYWSALVRSPLDDVVDRIIDVANEHLGVAFF